MTRKIFTQKARRIVLKIGTNVISDKGTPNETRLKEISHEISELINKGKEVIVVTSGAIGYGAGILLPKGMTPKTIPMKQACASVGQPILMSYYRKYFQDFGFSVGQILLTNDIVKHNAAFRNARNTMLTLIGKKSIPIVNENDSVSVDEIKFGDNDSLAAAVSLVVGADTCVLLSDIDGFYLNYQDEEKREKLDSVKEITDFILKEAGGNESAYSTGGMKTKINAAKILMKAGINMAIISGKTPGALTELFNGNPVGTIFAAEGSTLSGVRRWLKEFAKVEGSVEVDEGAYQALIGKGKSLLPSGIIGVNKNFDSGAAVDIEFAGKCFARGISWYHSADIKKIMGKKTSEIHSILGYKDYDEIIHRDNLLIINC